MFAVDAFSCPVVGWLICPRGGCRGIRIIDGARLRMKAAFGVFLSGKNQGAAVQILNLILVALATVVGAMGTLTILTMLMAAGANSTPQQITNLKWMMLTTAVLGLLCLVLGPVLAFRAYPLAGGAVGVLPMAVVVVGIIWIGVS